MFIFRTTLSLIISFSAMYVNDICNKEFSSPHFKEPCLFLDQQSITVMQPNSHSEKTSSNYADNIWTSYPRASKLPITLLPIHICVCLSLKAWLLHTVCVCVCVAQHSFSQLVQRIPMSPPSCLADHNYYSPPFSLPLPLPALSARTIHAHCWC